MLCMLLSIMACYLFVCVRTHYNKQIFLSLCVFFVFLLESSHLQKGYFGVILFLFLLGVSGISLIIAISDQTCLYPWLTEIWTSLEVFFSIDEFIFSSESQINMFPSCFLVPVGRLLSPLHKRAPFHYPDFTVGCYALAPQPCLSPEMRLLDLYEH